MSNKLTTNKSHKKNSEHITPPSVPDMNKDVQANKILKAFNDMKENTRMEITDVFNEGTRGTRTTPSVFPKMKK